MHEPSKQETEQEYINKVTKGYENMNTSTQMQLATIQEIIAKTNGRFFTVVFKKKDGSYRTMNCRTGVHKHLKGGKATFNAQDKAQGDWTVGVWENQKGYRCFKASQVVSITTNGLTVNFD